MQTVTLSLIRPEPAAPPPAPPAEAVADGRFAALVDAAPDAATAAASPSASTAENPVTDRPDDDPATVPDTAPEGPAITILAFGVPQLPGATTETGSATPAQPVIAAPAPLPPGTPAGRVAGTAEGNDRALPDPALAGPAEARQLTGATPADGLRRAVAPQPARVAEAGSAAAPPTTAAEVSNPGMATAPMRPASPPEPLPVDPAGADPLQPATASLPPAPATSSTPSLPAVPPPAPGAPPAFVASAPPPAFAAPVLPQGLPGDLAAVLHAAPDGPVELRLSPEELGRLHVRLSGDGDMLRVTIFVERPETLDLLRRHADLLVHEIRSAGFAGGAFTFTGWGGGGTQGQPDSAPPATRPDATESGYAHPTVSDRGPPPASVTGLHLRL